MRLNLKQIRYVVNFFNKSLGSTLLSPLTKIIFKITPKSIASLRFRHGYITYSQASQDIFVRLMLSNKKNGVYLEIGAYDEIKHSNTYILERLYGWKGASFEIIPEAVKDFNLARKNKCYCQDATKFDFYRFLLDNHFPAQIDYLSLDIEPAEQTLSVLKSLPLDRFRFSVITYEHDMYVSGAECMIESRKILESFGYVLVAANVKWKGRDFEDWYIDPNIVSENLASKFRRSNVVAISKNQSAKS